MEKLTRACFMIIAVATLSLGLTSCKDTCYECVGFDDGSGNSLEDSNVCEGEANDAGGTYTEETLEAEVALYELFGGTCTKK